MEELNPISNKYHNAKVIEGNPITEFRKQPSKVSGMLHEDEAGYIHKTDMNVEKTVDMRIDGEHVYLACDPIDFVNYILYGCVDTGNRTYYQVNVESIDFNAKSHEFDHAYCHINNEYYTTMFWKDKEGYIELTKTANPEQVKYGEILWNDDTHTSFTLNNVNLNELESGHVVGYYQTDSPDKGSMTYVKITFVSASYYGSGTYNTGIVQIDNDRYTMMVSEVGLTFHKI